jgi:acetoacetate decarboxylase
MPVSFGQTRPLKAGIFEDVLSLSTRYRTDKDASAAFLPEPFEPADTPIVTVYYQQCRRVNFLAGGGYNLLGVNLSAHFNGRRDQVTGNFALVLWENDTHPIIRGRELLGLPKLFGEIPDPFRRDDLWQMQVSENGRLLVEMKIGEREPLEGEALAEAKRQASATPWMGWRYIPNVTGAGAALSQATRIGQENFVAEAWRGQGVVCYGDEATWEACPFSGDIVAALKTLPILEYMDSTITRGSIRMTRALNRVLE